MGKRKTIVFVFTLLLVVLAGLVELTCAQLEPPLRAIVSCEGGEETIEIWYQSEDTCYLFLPSFADPAQIRLEGRALSGASIDGQKLSRNISCADFPMNKRLHLTYRQYGIRKEDNLFILQSADVPTMYIDTVSGSLDYIHEEKGNEEPGSLRLYHADGTLDCSAQIEAINGRGNGTWDPEKKPYSVKLTTSEDLLGMGAAEKWILLANAYDDSNLRNKLAYDFAADVGAAYTPETRFVDLYVNGDYRGLYQLSERNEVHPQRVAIDEDGTFLITRDLLWRIELGDHPYIATDRENYYRIHHQGMPFDELWNLWQSVENAIFAEDGIDPVSGKHWTELIDMDSWAQQFLFGEVFQNEDAGVLSLYFYYDKESQKVVSGPIWDMDLTLNRRGENLVNSILSSRQYTWNRSNESILYHLYQKEEFHQRVIQMYFQEFRPLLQTLVDEGIDAYAGEIAMAAKLNNLRWGCMDAAESTESMRLYLQERLSFLDRFWSEENSYCYIEIFNYSQWRKLAVRRGDTAEFLRVVTQNPWYVLGTGELFDITAPVTQDWILEPQPVEET